MRFFPLDLQFATPERPARAWLTRALTLALPATLAACGDAPRAASASTTPSAQSAEVSIRFDVSAGRPATVQVLAFRATTTSSLPGAGTPTDWGTDVLGLVDPLAATSPEQGCALRDIDLATTTLMIRGGSIELQELSGIGVGLGGGEGVAAEALLRPFPRLYPDVATVVGGVVAETGPQPLGALPDHVTLFTAESELPVANVAVPAAVRIVALNGVALAGLAPSPLGDSTAGAATIPPAGTVNGHDGLAVTVANGAGGRIEIRPFGATIAAACAIPTNAPAEAVVTIPRGFVAQLARSTGGAAGAPFAASLEVARRATLRPTPSAAGARVSVEVRSATTVELRP
ncbi:MAG TPA: hypothetical protein VH560_08010 [Polyangia bacterium]|nr:hypothetical protein [Polyangia bacterium]